VNAYHTIRKAIEEVQSAKKPNIMLLGKTGAGKSTLVNNVFKWRLEKLAQVGKGSPCTQQNPTLTLIWMLCYDTKGLELADSTGWSSEQLEWIHNMQGKQIHEQLHCVWWIIASGNRVEEFETKFVKQVKNLVPVIVILTHCDKVTEEDVNLMKEPLGDFEVVTVINKSTTQQPHLHKNQKRAPMVMMISAIE